LNLTQRSRHRPFRALGEGGRSNYGVRLFQSEISHKSQAATEEVSVGDLCTRVAQQGRHTLPSHPCGKCSQLVIYMLRLYRILNPESRQASWPHSKSMSSPLNTPSPPHRRIARLPVRPRNSSGQPGTSQNLVNPHSLSPEISIGTGQCSSISCASHRRHSYHHPDATADACHLSPPAAHTPEAIFQFGHTRGNSQPGEQHETFTFRLLHNATPRPSPQPEKMGVSPPQNPPAALSASSLPIPSISEHEDLQPLHTLYSDEKIAINGVNDLPEPVYPFRIKADEVVTSGGVTSPSRSVPSLSFTQKSVLSPSPNLHSRRISDISIASEKNDTTVPYDVGDEKAPLEPFFALGFQAALQKGLGIAKSTVAAIERLGGSSKPRSDLNRLLKVANDLSTFQSSDTRTIALLGDSGEGIHGCCQRRGCVANCFQGRVVS